MYTSALSYEEIDVEMALTLSYQGYFFPGNGRQWLVCKVSPRLDWYDYGTVQLPRKRTALRTPGEIDVVRPNRIIAIARTKEMEVKRYLTLQKQSNSMWPIITLVKQWHSDILSNFPIERRENDHHRILVITTLFS